MRTSFRTSWLLGLATLTLASSAFAGTVTFKLTGVGPSGANMAGVYTSPYQATINGVPVLAICDDFGTNSSIGQTFTAVETNVASLQGGTASTDVKFNQGSATAQQKNYATAAYLATQLLGIDQSTAAGKVSAGKYSYAIWGLFTPSAFTHLSNYNASYGSDAQGILNAALALNLTPSMYSNVYIYTPATPTPGQGYSQEFIVVRTDEPQAAALLGFNILALLSLVFFFRKRLIRAA